MGNANTINMLLTPTLKTDVSDTLLKIDSLNINSTFKDNDGLNIWTDGDTIYYTNGRTDYYTLDKSSNKWNSAPIKYKTGNCVWSDGTNIYHSDGYDTHSVFENGSWSDRFFYINAGISGLYMWRYRNSIYWSNYFTGNNSGRCSYKLNIDTGMWEKINISFYNESSVIIGVLDKNIWYCDDKPYYSSGNTHREFIDDGVSCKWNNKTWSGLTSFDGMYIRNINNEIFYSNYQATNSPLFRLADKENGVWEEIPWVGTSSFFSPYMWEFDNNIYYSNGSEHYILNGNTWEATSWSGLTSFDGRYIKILNGDAYYFINHTTSHYKLIDKDNHIWQKISWMNNHNSQSAGTAPVWTDGENIYYSNGSTQGILNHSSNSWEEITWSGVDKLFSSKIEKIGNHIYFSDNYKIYKLVNSENIRWEEIGSLPIPGILGYDKINMTISDKNYLLLKDFSDKLYIIDNITCDITLKQLAYPYRFYGYNVWSDYEDVYIGTSDGTFKFDKNLDKFIPHEWNSDISIYASGVWSDSDRNVYYSNNHTHYMLDKQNNIWNPVSVGEVQSFSGRYIYNINNSIYYLNEYDHYKLVDSDTGTFEKNTMWSTKSLYGYNIWTIGDDIYYSGGSDNQYIFNKESNKFNKISWNGLETPYRTYIWMHGDDVYYSNGSAQYKLTDVDNRIWSKTTWSGLTSFDGSYVWTDGNDTYYSCNTDHYKLVDNTNMIWEKITWSGLTSFSGNNIWMHGDDVYYSNVSAQYKLTDVDNHVWSPTTWSGLTSFSGNDIWTIGDDVYYSYGLTQYKLSSTSSNKFNKISWNGLETLYGSDICIIGNDVYYLYGTSQYKLTNINDLTWESSQLYIPIKAVGSIYTVGNDVYYNGPYNYDHYRLVDNDNFIWEKTDWDKVDATSNIWKHGDKYYWALSHVYNETTHMWEEKTWTGISISTFWSSGICVINNTTYYAYSNTASYKLIDADSGIWEPIVFNGISSIVYGKYFWTCDNEEYYSNGSSAQYRLSDKESFTWEKVTWSGSQNIYGNCIWEYNDDIYYSNGSINYKLIKGSYTWEKIWDKTTLPNLPDLWTDGSNMYYSDNYCQCVLDNGEWKQKTFTGGPTDFNGKYIWCDATNTYMSYRTSHYILNNDNTWDRCDYTGLLSFDGDCVWNDGNNVYCCKDKDIYLILKKTPVLVYTRINNTWIPMGKISSKYSNITN